ncbi:hypothetical protein ERJ75_001430500 [Trypanosoma vivax]|uniref:Uncharacterized protein n=1 Tax=Trypanosoma vivax (strain Y486) TaxID=1055687 RepID=G0TTN6_TRYVY|nr:hypothetical protein TRVL_00098 [Trypanosoma vivax]KAH8606973.1 hypothetical protein ERJ75_001430500 [Trypanosoma vivax]CCC47317.1 conserved hypothetical protein [Trypanosoma vivax Y486]
MRWKEIAEALVGLLHAIYTSLYVDVYLRQHVLPNASHWSAGGVDHILLCLTFAQLLYALWFWKITLSLGRHVDLPASSPFCRRLAGIASSGPVLASSFVLLWLPAGAFPLNPALLFTATEVLYEASFTHCKNMLNKCKRNEMREPGRYHRTFKVDLLSAIAVMAACSLCASTRELRAFRWFMATLATGAGVGIYICGRQLERQRERQEASVGGQMNASVAGVQTDVARSIHQTTSRVSMKAAMLLFALNGYCSVTTVALFNFMIVAVANSFTRLFERSLLLLLVFLLPHAIHTAVAPLCSLLGKRRLMSIFLAAQAAVGMLFLIVALLNRHFTDYISTATLSATFVFLLVLNHTLNNMVNWMQKLVFTDIVDEDTAIFSRPQPAKGALQQILRTISKSFRGLALVLTCSYLSFVARGESLKMDDAASVVGWPTLLMSVVTLWSWRRYYNLEGFHLQFVRAAARQRQSISGRVV